MTTNYIELYDHLEKQITNLGNELAGPMSGFARLHRKAVEDNVLTGKTKELIAIAISIAIRCEGCIVYHVHDAVLAGATREEMIEAIGVAILMGGAPAAVYATYAMDAVEQFLEEQKPKE